MTDISKYTHKFRATGEAFQHQQQQNGTNKINKRNRQPLSCNPCRLRKLKCDRGHPCETCSKKGDEATCIYGKVSDLAASPGASRSKAQDRLRQLEQLVMQMVDSHDYGTQPTTSNFGIKDQAVPKQIPTPTSSDYSSTDGHLQYDSGQSKYLGSTHWTAILDNIQELKTAIATDREGPAGIDENEVEEDDEEGKTMGEEVLFGSSRNLSLQQILAESLPERLQVNGRLSTYFNSRYLLLPIIHTTQFQRQYDEFWRDPLAAPPLWVSILFSICCMSATLTEKISSEPRPSSPPASAIFLKAAAQCLVLGGYTMPKRYVVEALALYAMCRYHLTLDPSRMVGIIFSILVRLAYRMGYHRDPSHFAPKFTVFESEMRRRTWAMCRQFDLMVSFQLGLPNNVPPDSWDTDSPANLLDTDFDETTTILPPSRSENEATQILYFIVKSRLMTVFGRILAHVLSFPASSQQTSEIMTLDAEARRIYATVPPPLRIRPMSQCIADPAYLIMVRLNAEFLYHKSICVLHRKYMLRGSSYSTTACVDSAMAIAGHMVDVHAEFMPGGQLYKDRWMLNSFTMNDFLLAAVVLCLSLSMWKRRKGGMMGDTERAQYEMLKKCHAICLLRAKESKESRCVAPALKTVIEKLEPDALPRYDIVTPFARAKNSSLLPGLNLSPLSLQDGDVDRQQQEQQQQEQRSGVLATVMSPFNPDPSLNFEALFNFDMDLDENTNDIDWTAFDQFLVNPDAFGYYIEPEPARDRGYENGNGNGVGEGNAYGY